MSSSYLARDIAARLHHRASYIGKDYGDIIADLREIASANIADQRVMFDARKLEILASFGFDPIESSKPFAYADGVAIIPIHGLLINRLSWSYSFATGYNFIRSQRLAAIADPDVKLIVYDVNSPGGVASGCAELAQEMYDGRADKPSLSVVDARCYSAAYFLASAANRIVVTPSGGVGNIGCLAMHIDHSGVLNAEGLKITLIFAGDEKVDGNPYQSLSSRARASIQRDVDYHYGLFVEAVARHRDLSEDDVRATEAGAYLPPEALDIGLIDGVETPTEAVANFFNEITSDADGGDETMTTQPATGAAPTAPAMSQADIDAAIAIGLRAAVAADRQRQATIRTCPEAEGRSALADHLALNTEMSAEDAKGILAAAPKEAAAAPATADTTRQPTGFAAAMDQTRNPNVGADAPTGAAGVGGTDVTPHAKASRLLSIYAAATGQKVIDLKPQVA
jgi:ClpP class serine protease